MPVSKALQPNRLQGLLGDVTCCRGNQENEGQACCCCVRLSWAFYPDRLPIITYRTFNFAPRGCVCQTEQWNLNPKTRIQPCTRFCLLLTGSVSLSLQIYIFENNIYYQSDVKSNSLRLTSSGKEGVIFNGIADWLYEGKPSSSKQTRRQELDVWWRRFDKPAASKRRRRKDEKIKLNSASVWQTVSLICRRPCWEPLPYKRQRLNIHNVCSGADISPPPVSRRFMCCK